MNSPLALLGLAKRAGKLVVGFTNCLQAIQNKRATLVIITKDAGVDKKKIIRACHEKGIRHIEFGTKDEFRQTIGSPSCFLAILSRELSQGFLAKTQQEFCDGNSDIQNGGGD